MVYKKRNAEDGQFVGRYQYDPDDLQVRIERKVEIGPPISIVADGIFASAEVRGVDAEQLAVLFGAAPDLLWACEMAAAFIGSYTGNGVPSEYSGRFDPLLSNPEASLVILQNVIKKAKGVK